MVFSIHSISQNISLSHCVHVPPCPTSTTRSSLHKVHRSGWSRLHATFALESDVSSGPFVTCLNFGTVQLIEVCGAIGETGAQMTVTAPVFGQEAETEIEVLRVVRCPHYGFLSELKLAPSL